MSRGRPVGQLNVTDDNDEMAALTKEWHDFIDTIRLLPKAGSNARAAAEGEDEIDIEIRAAEAEKQIIDDAIAKVTALAARRRAYDAASRSPAPIDSAVTASNQVSTPTSAGPKRRRRPSGSVSASPAPAPIPNAPHTGGSESALSSIPSPVVGRAGTPLFGRDTASKRGIKDGTSNSTGGNPYADQLPLRAGRRIAVKEKQARGDDDHSESNWILATIKKSLGQDKTRYEVQDADDGTTWNTTLRSIIPLPDPSAPPTVSSHPSNLEDFGRGTQVLALYPDTTSFYRATVVSAPYPGTGMGFGVKGNTTGRPDPGAKREKYRLAFVDDGDNIQEVHKDSVVLFPSHI